MFSFIDLNLYGEGKEVKPSVPALAQQQTESTPPKETQHALYASQRAKPVNVVGLGQNAVQAGSPPANVEQSPPALPSCACSKELQELADALGARLQLSDKRALQMEQRLLEVLEDAGKKRTTAASSQGCSWGVLFLVVVFILMVFTWISWPTSSRGVEASNYPMLIQNSMPASPMVLPLGANRSPPATFMRT